MSPINIESNREKIASKFLGQLEMAEAGLLSWGLVDGKFTEQELFDVATVFCDGITGDNHEVFSEPLDLLDYLEQNQFIFPVSDSHFRTRMAETIRLIARLRQLFPGHLAGTNWQTASSLVMDYRFQLRRREVPKRTHSPDSVLESANKIGVLGTSGYAALTDLLRAKTESPLKLSTFQLRSIECILSDFKRTPYRGTIVCSGTGSGKTMAFYLPALARISDLIDRTFWTKCLAIYPRKELLKDQFAETFRQVRYLDNILNRNKQRKLVIGALFGSTPSDKQGLIKGWAKDWKKTSTGYRCPFMGCPTCGENLIWEKGDFDIDQEILRCVNASCGMVIGEDEIILTRRRMKKTPPDILFTTTEMLNQRMGDSGFRHLFGLGKTIRNRPEFVLLDEVHTYSGIQGAQTAMLLRRWKYASGARPHFVGLSATLRDAKRFFSRLTGINETQVDEVAPLQQDMEKIGMEYLLALRNDPVSGASVISTTIQASMLIGRILTPRHKDCPGKLFGNRLFVFTDDLDVTNRLYFNMLDAEGCYSSGQPISLSRRPHGALANLRRHALPGHRHRFLWGQAWDLCESIGHGLQPGDYLQVGRTSSQDSGVADLADMIVATASLEVGFNDPTVGAVIQHKAPHDMAQFLQRKGRAGRDPRMRPWTIVVLSDYGRDRLVYQGYDLLFDPELTPRNLPIENRYVLRMQSVYAFMDWISDKLDAIQGGNVWQNFCDPAEAFRPGPYRTKIKKRQEKAAIIVEEILNGGQNREDLSSYIKGALRIDDNVLLSILWDPPRALFTAVLPTLLRRLQSGWRYKGELLKDLRIRNNPLPEFIPSNLFSELNLPEVVLPLPDDHGQNDQSLENMSIYQAMKEFAPGRVSKRFAVSDGNIRHWIAPPSIGEVRNESIAIDQYCSEMEELGQFEYDIDGEPQAIRCIRPFRLRLTQTPDQVKDTSNSSLDWKTQIVPFNSGLKADLPTPSALDSVLKEFRFYTHNQHSHLEMRRFAIGTDATVNIERVGEWQTKLSFVSSIDKDAEPIGVGYAIDVDGLVIRFKAPTDLVDRSTKNPFVLASLRSAYFKDLVREDDELSVISNIFRRDWISQIYLTALVNIALSENIEIDQARNILRESDNDIYTEILDIIFQSLPGLDDGENQGEPEQHRQRIQNELIELLQDSRILERLHDIAIVLWKQPDNSWDNWLRKRFKATLGAAIFDATQRLCSDFDSGDLILDLCSGPQTRNSDHEREDVEEFWLTETTPGGGGFVEELLGRYGEDPRRFIGLIESALEPSDYEVMDNNLTLFLNLLIDKKDEKLQHIVSKIRDAETHKQLEILMKELIQVMVLRGIAITHPVMVALNARVIKPGSSDATDKMIWGLIRRWKESEIKIGVEVDARLFAYVCSKSDELDNALGDISAIGMNQDLKQWRYGTISGLLWPRGQDARSKGLSVRNPFQEIPSPEREIVRCHLKGYPTIVDITEAGWQNKVESIVSSEGAVAIRAPSVLAVELKAAILKLMIAPIDAGYLFIYPRIRSVRDRDGYIDILLESSEVLQCQQ